MRTIRVSVRGARGLAEDASSRAVLTLPGSEPVESELVSGSAEPAFGLEAEWRVGTDDASLTRLVTTPALVRLVDATAPSAPSALDGTPPEAAVATLASEAEAEFRLEAAANYHHERVATAPTIAAAWLAYGTFLLRTGRGAKAEECSREAIAVDPEYAEAMLVHGVTLASRSNHEQAEPFLRAALDAAPEDAQLWLLMAVVYERMERGRDARVALRQASTLLGEGSETGPHYLALAQRLLPYAASPLIDEALERAGGTDTLAANLVRAEMLLQRGELAPAETVLLAASEAAPRPRAAPALTLLGHAQLRQGKAAEARATYERALSLCGAPLPAPLLLHLGAVCQSEGDAARARHLFLHASRLSPSCTSWLGAGVACLALELYDEAEQCLCEANILDNRRPDVWGQLALLCQRRDRTVEAEEALEQATRLNLADGKLLVAIGAAFFDGGVWAAAEGCFRRALAVDATPLTMQRLADSLLEQQSYKEALAAYRRAMQAVAEDAAGGVAQACGRQIKRVLAHMGLPEDDQDDSEQLPLDGTTG